MQELYIDMSQNILQNSCMEVIYQEPQCYRNEILLVLTKSVGVFVFSSKRIYARKSLFQFAVNES